MSKKNDAWMPLYIGDYLADTSRLSTEQHGAYLLILMDYWRNGPPLDDDEELANITKLTPAQWRKHAPKIRPFFDSRDGRLVQKRAEEERATAGMVSSKRSEAGKAGAAKRWGKTEGKGIANAIANAIAGPMASEWQNDAPSHSHSQDRETEDSERATRAPAPEPDTQGHQPTPQGLICRAMKAQGMQAVNPGDPRLLALIAQGATLAEFEGLAAEAVSKHKGFAWLLTTLQARREDAASIRLAKAEPARQPWAGAL